MHAPASCDDEAEEGRDRGKGEAPPRLTHAAATAARAANTILPPRDFCVRRTRAHLAVGRRGHPSDTECNHIGIGASVAFKIGDKLHIRVVF